MILLSSYILPPFLFLTLPYQLTLHNAHHKRLTNGLLRPTLCPTQDNRDIYTLYHTTHIPH
jgi:hypothetical protein